MSILIFIIAIALLILIHEIGHFVAAKLVGIPIQEFGIGFPPKLLTLFKAGGTDFTLNAIPLGGFVRPKETGDEILPDELLAAAPWKRVFVYISGPLMNFIAAVLMLAIVFYQSGHDLEHIQITFVVPGAPAAEAQLQPGDEIIAVNDIPTAKAREISSLIDQNKGQQTKITYLRDSQEYSVILVPRLNPPADEGPIGIGMQEPATAFGSIVLSLETIQYQLMYITTVPVRLVGYKGMFTEFENAQALDSVQQDMPPGANTIWYFASISISLAMINLLPIPLFDGGKILLAFPELLFKRRVSIKFQYAINFISLGLVIFLMIYVNVQDFINPLPSITPTP